MIPEVTAIEFNSEPSTTNASAGTEANTEVELVSREGGREDAERAEEREQEQEMGPVAGPSNWRQQAWRDTRLREDDVGLRSYSERGGF